MDLKDKVFRNSLETCEYIGGYENAKSILTVLTLGATKDTSVVLTADGPDEEEALAAMSKFLTTNHD